MAINLQAPDIRELKPHITVFGVGGAGGNAVNNMIESGLQGVEFVVANTDAQALTSSKAQRIIQMGLQVTEGLGAGSQPEVGRAAAEEVLDEIRDQLSGSHMAFITAGMGGGTGTGAAPVVARAAREMGILTVGVVTKPFQFEGMRRMRLAEAGISELQQSVDTLIVIPNQNLFRVATEKTTFADAFAMADQVLYSGVACITDLMVKEGLINLDFADVRAVMRGMGKAMMGTGEASGDNRAIRAAEAAIANPLLDDVSMKGARGLLISITGGNDLTLYELDEAATRIREESTRMPTSSSARPSTKPGRNHPGLGRGDRHRSRAPGRFGRDRLDGTTYFGGGGTSARRGSRPGCTDSIRPDLSPRSSSRAGKGRPDRRGSRASARPGPRSAWRPLPCGRWCATTWSSRRRSPSRRSPTSPSRCSRPPGTRSRRPPPPTSRRRPSGRWSAPPACRGWTNCRCRPRTRSAPAAATRRPTIRNA
jgi:cell division protein FtsZ